MNKNVTKEQKSVKTRKKLGQSQKLGQGQLEAINYDVSLQAPMLFCLCKFLCCFVATATEPSS